jgi:xanthine dehydrogenase accessory factor
MVVTAEHTHASIGGGRLEFLAVARARELLAAAAATQVVEGYPLGAEARQCCGGSVSLLFEVLLPQRLQVALFGAGHVARALLPILGGLDVRVHWIDSRRELLADAPANARIHRVEDPVSVLPELPPDTQILILTHDHVLDYRLVHAALTDWRWRGVGLIGSRTKAERFRTRLVADGLAPALIDRLVCPVGLPGLRGKRPMEVAVAIAAQLLAELPVPARPETALDWRQLRELLEAQVP